MYVIRRHVLGGVGFLIELIQGTTGGADLSRIARQLKRISPIFDLNVEALFDLFQVLIELSAQGGQSAGVSGFQFQVLSGYCLVQWGQTSRRLV